MFPRPSPLPLLLVAVALVAAPPVAGGPSPVRVEGERFTYRQGDISFGGILLKPDGKGPFPAVLLSHGLGGSAAGFALPKARELVRRGFVCIGPDYTHSGRGGDRRTFGASRENVDRALRCLDYLRTLPEVDPRRIYAYGNSMGAFLTIGLVADHPDRVAAAAITAGGVAPAEGLPAPSVERASRIRVPVLILHGDADTTVPAERSARLEQVLKERGVRCERVVYPGVGHNLHQVRSDEVLRRLSEWFAAKPPDDRGY